MKKLAFIIFASAILCAVTACNSSTNVKKTVKPETVNNQEDVQSENVQIPSPFVDVPSAEDFKSIGVEIDAPKDAENVSYSILDGKIACINFNKDDENYTLRASASEDELIGIYAEEKSSEELSNGAKFTAYDLEPEIFKAVITKDDIHYELSGGDSDTVKSIALEMM